MKKYLSIILIVIISLMLISCSEADNIYQDADKNSADRRLSQVAEAVNTRDKEMLKGLFSIYISEDNENFDEDIDSFMSYIKGSVVSYEIEDTPVAFEYSEGEGLRKKLMYWGSLCTDEENYSVFFVDYPIDSLDEESEGLHTLRIIKAEKEDMLEGTMEDWDTPGVYIWDY